MQQPVMVDANGQPVMMMQQQAPVQCQTPVQAQAVAVPMQQAQQFVETPKNHVVQAAPAPEPKKKEKGCISKCFSSCKGLIVNVTLAVCLSIIAFNQLYQIVTLSVILNWLNKSQSHGGKYGDYISAHNDMLDRKLNYECTGKSKGDCDENGQAPENDFWVMTIVADTSIDNPCVQQGKCEVKSDEWLDMKEQCVLDGPIRCQENAYHAMHQHFLKDRALSCDESSAQSKLLCEAKQKHMWTAMNYMFYTAFQYFDDYKIYEAKFDNMKPGDALFAHPFTGNPENGNWMKMSDKKGVITRSPEAGWDVKCVAPKNCQGESGQPGPKAGDLMLDRNGDMAEWYQNDDGVWVTNPDDKKTLTLYFARCKGDGCSVLP